MSRLRVEPRLKKFPIGRAEPKFGPNFCAQNRQFRTKNRAGTKNRLKSHFACPKQENQNEHEYGPKNFVQTHPKIKSELGPVLPSLFSVQFNSVQFSSIQFSSVRFSSVQFNSCQYFYSHISLFSSVQFSSVQISSVQFSSVQFSSAVLCRREHALNELYFKLYPYINDVIVHSLKQMNALLGPVFFGIKQLNRTELN